MNKLKKHVDTTYLSLDQAEERGFIHRDYIAHCLRWTHVVKYLYESQRFREAHVLDVGCGRLAPMLTLLHSQKMAPASYTGVEYGKITLEKIPSGFRVDLYENEDFVKWTPEMVDAPTVVTCFEMIEHIEPRHCIEVLRKINSLMNYDTVFFLSTPCWNEVDCAANHVNEIKYQVLGSVLESLGFEILETYGTFASIRDYADKLTPAQQSVYNDLRKYYDVNMVSCIMAPMFPANSRNALWKLKLKSEKYVRKFPALVDIPRPWSSSEQAEDFLLVTK